MANVSPEIAAAQEAHAARPFAVRWRDSHFSGEFRFETLDEAFAYVWQQWDRIQRDVRTYHHGPAASQLWYSYLKTPGWTVSLDYVVLAPDVSSY